MSKSKDKDSSAVKQNQVVYKGFDTIDVSFQGVFSIEILELLKQAQDTARANKEPELLNINGLCGHVGQGAIKHYQYLFDTGELGLRWFIKNSSNSNDWNIRVSVGSATLAAYGYHKSKSLIFEQMRVMGVKFLCESIARVDHAVDYLLPDFKLCLENFVARSNPTRSTQFPFPVTVKQRLHVETVMIGKNPGKVVIVYDKTAEIISSRKAYWYDIWGIDQDKLNKVWRIELRAHKKYLKET